MTLFRPLSILLSNVIHVFWINEYCFCFINTLWPNTCMIYTCTRGLLQPCSLNLNNYLRYTDSSSLWYFRYIGWLDIKFFLSFCTHTIALGAISTCPNHPKCEFNLHFGWFELVKMVPTTSSDRSFTVNLNFPLVFLFKVFQELNCWYYNMDINLLLVLKRFLLFAYIM